MRIKYTSVLSAVMYFVAFVSLMCLVGTDFTLFSFSHFDKFIAAVLFFAFTAFGAKLQCVNKTGSARRITVYNTAVVMFLVYLLTVVDFTLIDDTFGRSISSIFTCGSERLAAHIKNNVNLVPFKTIKLFINGYKNGNLRGYATAENLLGNFCVFMPFALFVPMVFKRINSAFKLFVVVAMVVVIIETLQFVFMTGCADIDDFLLNVSGCMLMYGVLRLPRVDKAAERASYSVWKAMKRGGGNAA